MATEVTPIDSEMEAILAPLLKREELLTQEEGKLVERLTEIRAEKTRINRVRSAAFPQPKVESTMKRPAREARQYISQEKLNALRAHFQNSDEPKSQPQLAQELGFSEPTINKGIRQLRDEGVLRLVGKTDTNARTYAFMGEK